MLACGWNPSQQQRLFRVMPGQSEAERDALLDQQRVLARFGELALRSEDLDEILTEACRLVGAHSAPNSPR